MSQNLWLISQPHKISPTLCPGDRNYNRQTWTAGGNNGGLTTLAITHKGNASKTLLSYQSLLNSQVSLQINKEEVIMRSVWKHAEIKGK